VLVVVVVVVVVVVGGGGGGEKGIGKALLTFGNINTPTNTITS